MKIFILEDDPGRIRWFRERFINHETTFVISCIGVDNFEPPYDLILLDHDLGGRQLDEHEDCGHTFVKLIKDKLRPEDTVIIHSYNGVGAGRMLDEIPEYVRAVYAPYRGVLFDKLMAGIKGLNDASASDRDSRESEA